VIDATRDFVCIRLDSYESDEAQQIVRRFLNGRFANTAFCLLDPDWETELTRGGRSPNQVVRSSDLAKGLKKVAAKYREKGRRGNAVVPSHPEIRMAVNFAAADEQLLVVVKASKSDMEAAKERLQKFTNDPAIIGRFHYFFEESQRPGIELLQPDAYGQEARRLTKFPLATKISDLKAEILKQNERYGAETKRKVYRDHVRRGRRLEIEWKMPMEYGEDRDGDGEIDYRGGARRGRERRAR
jgi:hypothetical protein